ncbi:MAG TPA: 4-hydroxy-tetrahydrodipicolinate synthase [Noviherbaspirillum sp.]
MTRFTGIWVPLVTPFRHGQIDMPALQALARRLHSDVSGMVVCGTTGEAAALDEDEQRKVLDTVLRAAPGANVVMGLAGNNLPAVIARLKQVQERPIAGVLVPPPYYIRPSQAGLVDYFHALADAASVPIIVYNIPYRTGVAMEFDTLATLAEHPRIAAIKDCGGDAALTMRLIAETKLQVLAGEDQQLLSILALGGSGGIMASAHLRPDLFAQVVIAMQEGRISEAREMFYRLLPMIRLMFQEPNPAPLKAALAQLGWMKEELRPPMRAASSALKERIAMELAHLSGP